MNIYGINSYRSLTWTTNCVNPSQCINTMNQCIDTNDSIILDSFFFYNFWLLFLSSAHKHSSISRNP